MTRRDSRRGLTVPQAPLTCRYVLEQKACAAGGWARVFRGWDVREGRVVAIKQAYMWPECAAVLWREARLLSCLEHPAIPACVEVFEEQGQTYLVEEWRAGQPLDRQHLTVAQVRLVGRALTTVLGDLHALGITHGDLAPGNVLFGEEAVSLIDFGLASTLSDPQQARGTRGYASPEQWSRRQMSVAGQVYSLAMVLGCALTMSAPEEVVRVGSFSALWDAHSPWERLPEVARMLVVLDRAIVADPRARPALGALVEAFAGEEVAR